MTGLLDIAPQRATVVVHGHALEVAGVTVRGIADLLQRFPELRQLFAGGDANGPGAIEQLAATMPDLVAAAIASGLGHANDRAHEDAAAALPAEAQAKLFGAVLKLTMPSGIGPFVEELATAFGGSPPAAAASANGSLEQSKSSLQ
jgi:hypothetical protein